MPNQLSPAYLQQISEFIANAVLYHIGLLRLIDEDPRLYTNDSYSYPIHVVGNASAHRMVNSLDPPPEPGVSQVVAATVIYLVHRIIWTETGDTRRAMGNADFRAMGAPGVTGGQNPLPGWDLEALIGFIAEDLLGASNYGFLGQVSASINFWDLSRTTYPRLKSVDIPASSAQISEALLNSLLRQVRDEDDSGELHKGMPDTLVVPSRQDEFLSNVTTLRTMLQGPGDISGGAAGAVRIYDNLAVAIIGGLLNSVVAAIRLGDWRILNHEAAPGGVHTLPYGSQGDYVQGQTTISRTLFCDYPWKQGKITGLATTWSPP
jgi:hypothetical protein